MWLCGGRQLFSPSSEGEERRTGGRRAGGWGLTVNGDPDLRVVVAVGDLPDIKGFRGRVGEQAEEQDDGVGRGKTFWVDLPGKRLKINTSVTSHGRGTLARRRYVSAFNQRQMYRSPPSGWSPAVHPRLIPPGSPPG